MKLSQFGKVAKEIILSGFLALSLFAVLAGQDAYAANKDTGLRDAERKIATNIAALTVLEQTYLVEKKRLFEIESAYQAKQVGIAKVFEQAIAFHNIEEALVSARATLVSDLMLLKSTEAEQQQSPQEEKVRLL